MISMDKQYQTVGGKKVKLLCVDRKHGAFPVVGLVYHPGAGEESVENWTDLGKWQGPAGTGHVLDLVEIAPQTFIYRAIYIDGAVGGFYKNPTWPGKGLDAPTPIKMLKLTYEKGKVVSMEIINVPETDSKE